MKEVTTLFEYREIRHRLSENVSLGGVADDRGSCVGETHSPADKLRFHFPLTPLSGPSHKRWSHV